MLPAVYVMKAGSDCRCRQEMTDKFRKERNVHRMHHCRIAQEKNKLINDIKVGTQVASGLF